MFPSYSPIKVLIGFCCGYALATLFFDLKGYHITKTTIVTNTEFKEEVHSDQSEAATVFTDQTIVHRNNITSKYINTNKSEDNTQPSPVEDFDFKDVHSQDDLEKHKNDRYWKLAPNYNVDDYGVPIEEYVLSVEGMKSLSPQQRVATFKSRNIKTVLYMHTAYGSKSYGFNYDQHSKQGQLPYIMKGCRSSRCFCTDQRGFIPMEDFDAIVFYSRGIRQGDRPKVRRINQRYILWEMEPPKYLISFQPSRWPDFFNWTHTYRRDSDIWEPWGLINQYKKFPKPIDDLIKNSSLDLDKVSQKKKSIAWFVSNCSPRSGRDKYIDELKKYIDVDVYGACGTLKCEHRWKCLEMVEKEYFFYFAAENSLCKDYITEKFFGTLRYKVVPIAFGGGENTNDYYFMPKKSYINAFDFKHPKELANFLINLKSNKNEYASYFWWKPYYNVWLGRWKKAHCEICDQLHGNKVGKTYRNFNDWWVTQSRCRPPWGR